MAQTLNDFPVKDLPDRYNIGRTWLYENYFPTMEQANLGKPLKKGNKSFITPEQLKFLDALDIATKNNQLDEFLAQWGIESESEQFTEQSGQLATIEEATLNPTAAMLTLAEMIVSRLPQPQSDPLAHIRLLDEACEKGWRLSSSELCILLKRSRIAGNEIRKHGFVCIREGKNGAESAWKIERE